MKTCDVMTGLTSHLSDHQGNTGASGLPGLVGFPGAGIQGEKARLMTMLGIFFPMFFPYSCNYFLYHGVSLWLFRVNKGLLGLLGREDLLDLV